MNEQEIIKYLESYTVLKAPEPQEAKMFKAVNGILNLYYKEKEKNKELENCLQMAKQIFKQDISHSFDYMELEEFKEYLLNQADEEFIED